MNNRKNSCNNAYAILKASFLLFIVMLLTVFAACAEGDASIHTTFETRIPGERRILVGYTTDLKRSSMNAEEGELEQYSYASDNPDIATVDAEGIVTGVASGLATIRAVSVTRDRTFLYTVNVIDRAPEYNAIIMGNTVFTPKDNGASVGIGVGIAAFKSFLEATQFNGVDDSLVCLEFDRQTGLNFLAGLSSNSKLKDLTENDVTLFYLASHGNENEGFYTNAWGIISYQEIRNGLDKINGRIVVLVDACYSGGLIEREEQSEIAVIKQYEALANVRNSVLGISDIADPFIGGPLVRFILGKDFDDGTGTLATQKYAVFTNADNNVVSHSNSVLGGHLMGFFLNGIGFSTVSNRFEISSPKKYVEDGVVSFFECIDATKAYNARVEGENNKNNKNFYRNWPVEGEDISLFYLKDEVLKRLGIRTTGTALDISEAGPVHPEQEDGSIIPSFQIDDIEPLQEFEPASFFTGIMHAPYCEFIVNGKSGLIDYEGNVLLEPKYDDVYYAERAIHYYDAETGTDQVYTYIENLKETTQFGYDDYSVWYWDRIDQELRMMDVAGSEYSKDEWDDGETGCEIIREIPNGDYSYENLFEDSNLGGYGLANRNGILVEPKYEIGLEYMFDGGGFFAFDDGKTWDIYGINGNYGFSVAHKTIDTARGPRTIYPYGVTEQTFAINTVNGAAIWDLNSSIPGDFIYEEARPVCGGKAWVKKDGRWRIISVAGSQTGPGTAGDDDSATGTPVQIDDIQPVEETEGWGFRNLPFCRIIRDGKVGLIDYDGNIIIEPEYQELYYEYNGCFEAVEMNGEASTVSIGPFWYTDDNQFESVIRMSDDIGAFVWNRNAGQLLMESGPVTYDSDIGTVVIREKLGDGTGSGGYGLANPTELILEPVYEDAVGYFDYDRYLYVFAFYNGSMWEYYNEDGKRMLDFECMGQFSLDYYDEHGIKPEPYFSTEELLAVNTQQGAGYCTLGGKSATGLVYEAARPVYHGMGWVKEQGAWKVIEVDTGNVLFDASTGRRMSRPAAEELPANVVKTYSGSVDVRFERRDHSYNDGTSALVAYYDLPVILGDSYVARRMNEIIQADYNEYVELMERLIRDEYYTGSRPEVPFANYIDVDQPIFVIEYSENAGREAGVQYDDGSMISIAAGGFWFMGGVDDYPKYTFTFDLSTGELLSITDVFGSRDEFWNEYDLLDRIKESVREAFFEGVDDAYYAGDFGPESYLDELSFDNLSFFVSREGELVLCFDRYQIGAGSMGEPNLATGIWVSDDY